MEPFLVENVGQILNCILYCITAFKDEINALKKIKICLKFYGIVFNLSLRERCKKRSTFL